MEPRSRRARLAVCSVTLALAVAALAAVAAVDAGAANRAATSDPGVGSQEALSNPACDPETKRVSMESYSAPLCVKPWKEGADNGGATAQGVDAKTITVVVLYGDPSEGELAARKGLYLNQATGENTVTAPVDSTKDWNEIYKRNYQTWGREVEFEFVRASGNDEAAQRADAVEVAAMKPFAVLDHAASINSPPVGGGAVFEQALENAGVPLVISTGANDPGALSRSYAAPTAEFIGKQLEGGKAEYADESMQDQPRKFGVIYPSNFEIDFLQEQLAKHGVTLASKAEFNVPPGEASLQTNSPEIDTQIPPLVSKLKADGVNNLIVMASHGVTTSVTKAMKAQEWFPEITATAFPYTDLDVLARPFDQEVWSHTFGLIWFLPSVGGGAPSPSLATFQWFWGTDKGTKWDGASALLGQLYTQIQFAGPVLSEKSLDLVPARLRKAKSGVGGAYSNSAFTFEASPPPPEGGTPIRGTALGWWDPNSEGGGNYDLGVQGKGQYQYLDNAKRYVVGTFPKAKKAFFDPSNSISQFEALPASEPTWPEYPCDGCPSEGNTTITPATGGQV